VAIRMQLNFVSITLNTAQAVHVPDEQQLMHRLPVTNGAVSGRALPSHSHASPGPTR
jgi:hypothetical protein